MIISRIISGANLHYNLHAEQSVTWALLDEPGRGVFDEMLTITTLERIYLDVQKHPNLNSILDFKHLKSVQNNLHNLISDIRGISNSLTILNVDYDTIKKLGCQIFSNPNNIKEEFTYAIFFVSDSEKIEFKDSADLFEDEFAQYLTLNTIDQKGLDGLLPVNFSSSVYLSKYIDVKKMISSNKEYFIYALYQLAMKAKKHWQTINTINPPTLVCQNLNSSYLVSILSSFLNLNMLILDKIGPINNLYSTLDNKIDEGKEYIIVSDVVCLGTEIKIARSIINFLGGKYIGNLSVVRIQTLDPKSKKFTDSESVYEITKDKNPIDFKITTNLD